MITNLRLQNFRSYKDASFELNPGVNIIVGPNASGKTNLLEAILVLARGSSYRVRDADLIRFEQPWSRLDSHNQNSESRTVKIISQPQANKIYEIDGQIYKRLTMTHALPVVLFEPGHLQLFSGGPERRRDYIDDLLEQTTAGFTALRRQYKRALSQRNHLLKQQSATDNQFFPWNVRLSQIGGQIARHRHTVVEQINKELPGLYKELSKAKTKSQVLYDSHWAAEHYESRFLKNLETSLAPDRARGFTTSGPHREDFIVELNGHPAQEAASRGEVRTVILALKIIELKLIEGAREKTPLLLLDDVFSELDGARRHALTDFVSTYQTFITTTDADIVTKNFTKDSNTIPLS